MLAQLLAAIVALGSATFYLAAFFFPEVHRQRDFVWSGVGFFYALVLWLCAGRLTGGVLLGQVASVSLIVWLGSQTLLLRRQQAAPEDKTEVTPEVSEQVKGFSFGKLLSPLTQRFQRQPSAALDKPETVATLIDEPEESPTEPEAPSPEPTQAAAAAAPADPIPESAPENLAAAPDIPAETTEPPQAAAAEPEPAAAEEDEQEQSNWPDDEASNWPDEEEASNWPDEEEAGSTWVDAPGDAAALANREAASLAESEPTAEANWIDSNDPEATPASAAEPVAPDAAEAANWVDAAEPEAIDVVATPATPVAGIGNAEPVDPDQAEDSVPPEAALDSLDQLPLEEAPPSASPDTSDSWDKPQESAW